MTKAIGPVQQQFFLFSVNDQKPGRLVVHTEGEENGMATRLLRPSFTIHLGGDRSLSLRSLICAMKVIGTSPVSVYELILIITYMSELIFIKYKGIMSIF